MLDNLSPPLATVPFDSIVVAYCLPDEELINQLAIEELALIEGSTAISRRKLFASGRYAAHQAVSMLAPEAYVSPILRSELGEPLFPPLIKGSISHCPQLACAAVTNNPKVLGVGIDTEFKQRKLSPQVVDRISTEAERAAYAHLDCQKENIWLRVFCAKEALFKACFPFIGRAISFPDVDIIFSDSASAHVHAGERFEALLKAECPRYTQLAVSCGEELDSIVVIAAVYKP